MTAPDDDDAFAELVEDLFTQLLDGDEVDRAATAARHPNVQHRLDEALALASGTAGRRARPRPSLCGYEIVRELGRGGMGTVYLARHRELDREVALKVLPHSFGASPRSRQRFLHEAQALAKLDHPHVVSIHRVVEDGDVLAFEMEHVDGPSLQQLLDHLREHERRHGAPTLQQVADRLGLPAAQLGARNLTQFFVRIGAKVAMALAAVHARGLVHRDVKPANVLLRKSGEPVLVDFGLARLSEPSLSRTGAFAGTPVYSAPEQLRGEPNIGPPADVYGLAATLYECLTLETPFAGHSTTDQLRRIETGRLRPLRRLAPGAPRDLETILAHAMEVEPTRRYPDAAALADDLQRLQDLQPIRARPAGPLRRLAKFVRRQRTPLVAGAVGAALVIAAMLPLLDHAEAANRDRAAAAALVREARLEVFAAQGRSFASARRRGRAVTGHSTTSDEALRSALAQYSRAVELAPDDAAIRAERDVTRLATWLRQIPQTDRDGLQRALDEALQRFGGELGPATRRTARRLALGTLEGPAAGDDADGDPADRAMAGLLGFLVGDLDACERALQSLPPDLRERPLVDAALGLVHRADGAFDLARVHLTQAQRHFPESPVLLLALADVALERGDLALARHWLAQVGADGDGPLRQRLEMDLQSHAAPRDELRRDYARLADLDPDDPTPLHRLAQVVWRDGDLDLATTLFDRLVDQWPRIARFHLDRARIALQRRDLAAYARQVFFVLERTAGERQSRGTDADLLEILRIGGLRGPYAEALAATGASTTGRALLGDELPVRGFVPARLAEAFEALVPIVYAAERATAAFVRAEPVFREQPGRGLILASQLVARLPVLTPTLRAGAAAVPRLAVASAEVLVPALQQLRFALSQRDWITLEPQAIEPPPGVGPGIAFGNALCTLDDRTGDGCRDVLAGAVNVAADVAGHVLLLDGRTAEVLAVFAGEAPGQMYGYSLAVIGDVDGDAVDDWLVGAPAGTPGMQHGLAELRSGRTHAVIDRLTGASPAFGVAVAGLGDVDGDGCPDFAVATSPLLRNTVGQGSVEVFSGRTRAPLAALHNDVPGVWFGACLARGGDFDGDGGDELVVGGNYGSAPGLVRVWSPRTGAVLATWTDDDPEHGYGSAVLGLDDIDGDGVPDVAVAAVRASRASDVDEVLLLSGRTGARLATLRGASPGSRFGASMTPFAVGPGRRGLAIGAPEGGVGASGSVEFFALDGTPLTTLLGPFGLFGTALAAVDDVDGDGRSELFTSGPLEPRSRIWRIASGQLRWQSGQ